MNRGIQGTAVIRGEVSSVNQTIAARIRRLKVVSKKRMDIEMPGLGPASAFGICEEFTRIDRFANNRKQEGVIGCR
jgi:hypothetical protein